MRTVENECELTADYQGTLLYNEPLAEYTRLACWWAGSQAL